MPFDLQDVVNDADLAECFTLLRSTGVFGLGGFIQNQPDIVTSYGTISNPDKQTLDTIPEGDRVNGMIVIHTEAPIYETRPSGSQQAGTSDVMVWHEQQWRVINVWDYSNRGGYFKALCGRMSGQ